MIRVVEMIVPGRIACLGRLLGRSASSTAYAPAAGRVELELPAVDLSPMAPTIVTIWGVEDVAGDLSDLVADPIVLAEAVSVGRFTFMKLATRRGYVTLRMAEHRAPSLRCWP